MTTKYTDQYVLINQVDYDLGPSLNGFSDDAINVKEPIYDHQVYGICVYVRLLDQFLVKHCNDAAHRKYTCTILHSLLFFSSENVVLLPQR
jgi:hypothetical protein